MREVDYVILGFFLLILLSIKRVCSFSLFCEYIEFRSVLTYFDLYNPIDLYRLLIFKFG